MINLYKKGISVFEALIVIAIVGILATVVMPEFSNMRKSQVIKNTSSEVLSSINKARSQTLASIDSSSYGVHFESDQIVVFKGTVFSDGDVNNKVFEITSPASISSINLTGNVSDIYFNRLSGSPSVTGTIIVSDSPNHDFIKTITVSPSGMASLD